MPFTDHIKHRAFGKNRSEAQVTNRARTLRLSSQLEFDSGSEAEMEAEKGSARKAASGGLSDDSILFSSDDEAGTASRRRKAAPATKSGSAANSDDDGAAAEQSTYQQDVDSSEERATQPQETAMDVSTADASLSSSQKKRPRLLAAKSSAEDDLPRAAWDFDDDGPDLLEQRSLGLVGLGGGAESGKKRFRKSATTGGRKAATAAADSDEDVFGRSSDEDDAMADRVAAPKPVQRTGGLASISKARSMMVDSSEDEM